MNTRDLIALGLAGRAVISIAESGLNVTRMYGKWSELMQNWFWVEPSLGPALAVVVLLARRRLANWALPARAASIDENTSQMRLDEFVFAAVAVAVVYLVLNGFESLGAGVTAYENASGDLVLFHPRLDGSWDAMTYIRRTDLPSVAAGLVILLAVRLVPHFLEFDTSKRVDPK